MRSDFTDGLNPQQQAAILAKSGPVLVLAGPGSGKTRVLTYRIAHLIGQVGVPADAIVAVTFTNKAAGEMRHRVNALLDGEARGLQIGTFHAICARLLRREGRHTPYGADYLIYDTDDQVAVITQALAELNIDPKKFSPRSMLGAISTAKNELISPAEYAGMDYFSEIVARVYPRYQSILIDNNAMDFDDLLMQMVMLLRENPDISSKYQRIFEFVLVDEFQDTNTAQYELVRLLGEPHHNVFVVGDEDQGIYAFRGADFRNVLRFRQDYPEAQVILLEQNYRSTQVILDTARAIIDKNPQRTPKALFTDRDGGDPVTVYEAYNEDFEARYIIEKIDELCRRRKLNYQDFAVMYRTNAQSRALEEVCIREGIPYALIGGVGFYKRREVRDLLAYLRLVNNSNDKISFSRIINVPRRGIGQKSLTDFQQWAANDCASYDDALDRLIRGEKTPLAGRTARLFAEFGLQLRAWRDLAAEGNLPELFDRITAETGYNLYLREISDTPEQAIEREENVRELRGLIMNAHDQSQSLTEFLADQSLVSDVDSLSEDGQAVTLLTLHAAKGLEFPVVFISGLEEGILPHMRSFDDPDGLAEERRLMYVGITRAKDLLFLSYAFRRSLYGSSAANLPSRFLGDLPPELTEGLSPRLTDRANQENFRKQTTWSADFTPPPRQPVFRQVMADTDLDGQAFRPPGSFPDLASIKRALEEGAQERRRANIPLRDKIIPFPGGKEDKERESAGRVTRFKTGQRVTHPLFGPGIVIDSRAADDDELVDVAFEDKAYGIKKLFASFGLDLLEDNK